MDFDYIIAGGGIAGAICAYQLSKHHKRCLILEKTEAPIEKRCGGGVPYTAVSYLRNIGISIDPLLADGAAVIQGHTFSYGRQSDVHTYPPGVFSLGTTRKAFDGLLLQNARNSGALIQYGDAVFSVEPRKEGVFVNGISARKFVCAVGARGLSGQAPHGQTVGISAHIAGSSCLSPSRFYFWYPDARTDSYFWAFPIGRKLWNIGVWYQKPDSSMKRAFLIGVQQHIKPNFPDGFEYLLLPKGEFLGNVDQRISCGAALDGIGDFAGQNNRKNGGGILYAIRSALLYAEKELEKG